MRLLPTPPHVFLSPFNHPTPPHPSPPLHCPPPPRPPSLSTRPLPPSSSSSLLASPPVFLLSFFLTFYLSLLQLLQRFCLEYHHEPLEIRQKMLTVPDKPVKIKFIERFWERYKGKVLQLLTTPFLESDSGFWGSLGLNLNNFYTIVYALSASWHIRPQTIMVAKLRDFYLEIFFKSLWCIHQILTLSWQPKLAGMFSITYSHNNKTKKKRFMSSYSICKQDKFI